MAKAGDTCTFCGRSSRDVDLMINGMSGCICNECATQAYEIVKEQLGKKKSKLDLDRKDLPKPEDIKTFLDQYIIGQDEAKRYLSVSVYNHYKRLMQEETSDDVEIEKSNIIMVGSTGTGKTLLARTIAKLLHVPFAIVDATVLTQAGYVGEDIESILTRLQQGLLKLLEGSIVNVPPQGGRKHPEQKMIPVDTKNILFICGGAFDGIEKKIAQRLNTRVVGYAASKDTAQVDRNNMLKYITPTDLKSFGLIPEIIGRLPILTYLNPLDRVALRNILTEPKNSIIKQYIKLFAMDNIQLSFDEDVYEFVVDKALEFKLGARGLRSIVEAIMMDAMYSMPSENKTEFHVTLEYAKEQFAKSDVNRLQIVGDN